MSKDICFLQPNDHWACSRNSGEHVNVVTVGELKKQSKDYVLIKKHLQTTTRGALGVTLMDRVQKGNYAVQIKPDTYIGPRYEFLVYFSRVGGSSQERVRKSFLEVKGKLF